MPRSVAVGRTLPFVRSFTHRPRRIPGDFRCPADHRDRDSNFAPIVPYHFPEAHSTGRGCPMPTVVAPPPRCREVWPSAQSSPDTRKLRVAPSKSRYDPPACASPWRIHPDVNNEQSKNMPRRGNTRERDLTDSDRVECHLNKTREQRTRTQLVSLCNRCLSKIVGSRDR